MKKTGCLNSELSYTLAKLGHFDQITVGDCGLPIPKEVQRIDLAVNFGIPSFYQVFEVIDMEAKFQKVIIASESAEHNPEFYNYIRDWASSRGVELSVVPHEEFKKKTHDSVAVVRTGECNPYANVILESNVSF